jgi:hypothetical protein
VSSLVSPWRWAFCIQLRALRCSSIAIVTWELLSGAHQFQLLREKCSQVLINSNCYVRIKLRCSSIPIVTWELLACAHQFQLLHENFSQVIINCNCYMRIALRCSSIAIVTREDSIENF